MKQQIKHKTIKTLKMNKYKKLNTLLLTAVIILVGTLKATAQGGAGITMVKDPKAEKILDKLSAESKKFTTVYASFDYNMKNEDAGIDETQAGELWFSGNKYRIELPGLVRVSTGKTLYTYLTEEDEVQISNAESDEEGAEMMQPSELLTIHEKGFKYQHIGSETIDGKSLDVIKLFPEKADKPFHTVMLYVDASKNSLYRIEIMGKDGSTFTYTLKKMNPNASFDKAKFDFDENQAGDVVDLR